MDIRSDGEGPAKILSNFHAHAFIFDGVMCSSMEGLLQSFKFKSPEMQVEICKYIGLGAKKRGREKKWWRTQTLWWRGVEYNRHSKEYQELLDRAYDSLALYSPKFRNALLATGNERLTHSIGREDAHHTVLTRSEFCSRLMRIRSRLQQEAPGGESSD